MGTAAKQDIARPETVTQAVKLWRAWALISGVLLPVTLLYVMIYSWIRMDGPVSVHHNQILLTPSIKRGESLRFQISVDRLRSCPGRIVDIYQQQRNETRAQIVRERAVVSTQVGRVPVLEFSLQPPDIRAGVWHFTSSLVSDCSGILWPTRHVDVIADFDFSIKEAKPIDD